MGDETPARQVARIMREVYDELVAQHFSPDSAIILTGPAAQIICHAEIEGDFEIDPSAITESLAAVLGPALGEGVDDA